MGFVNKITTPDQDAFPGALFEIAGNVPEAECQETKNVQVGCSATAGQFTITDVPDQWGELDLAGKEVVVAGTVGDDGTYGIVSNTPGVLTTDHEFVGTEGAINATVQDVGQTYLTRNISSFARFIHESGFAYTIKGGKLYTNCPDVTLADACSDTWNPNE